MRTEPMSHYDLHQLFFFSLISLCAASVGCVEVSDGRHDSDSLYAVVDLTVRGDSGGRSGVSTVEIIDESGHPVADAAVHGSFTGSVAATQRGSTNAQGVVRFESDRFVDAHLLGFRIDGLERGRDAGLEPVSRAMRIDTCSLALLAGFVAEIDAGSSRGLPLTRERASLAYADELPTVVPMRLSSSAAATMVVDVDWFYETIPNAGGRQLLDTSRDNHRIAFDRAWSFPVTMSAPAGACIELLVFLSPDPTRSTILVDPRGNHGNAIREDMIKSYEEMWTELQLKAAELEEKDDGIGTSPVNMAGIGTSPKEQDGIGTSPVQMAGIGTSPAAEPGIGTSPRESTMSMTGIGTSPNEEDGIGTSPVNMAGTGTSPNEEDGIGTSPRESTMSMTGIGTSPKEEDGIGTSPAR